MVPFKQKPKGMIKHTAVLLVLLCFSGSCFGFLQESRRKIEYHHRTSLKEEPRKIANHQREVTVLSPYVRDVGADSRQSRIDARDIRTDFREIRTELARDTSRSDRRSLNKDSRRVPDIDNSRRVLSDNIRSRAVRSNVLRLASREPRNLLNNNNVRTKEIREASRRRLSRFRETRLNEYSSSERRTSPSQPSERRSTTLDEAVSGRSKNVRNKPFGAERRDHRNDQQHTRRNPISDSRRFNARVGASRRIISSDELNEHQFARRRTTRSDTRERRENFRSRRTSFVQDRDARMGERRALLGSRRASLDETRERLQPQNRLNEKPEERGETIRIHDDRRNDTGARFTKNTGNSRVANKNYNDLIPSLNYKSNILITAAQAALVIMLFGQILGNASKNKLRLTNWRAIFSKEKMA